MKYPEYFQAFINSDKFSFVKYDGRIKKDLYIINHFRFSYKSYN